MNLTTRLFDLKQDLIKPGGPDISTNQSYPFALFQYLPQDEFRMREILRELIDELRSKGWSILNVDLFTTLLDFLEEQEEGELIDALIEEEKLQYRAHKGDYTYPLNMLSNTLDMFFKDMEAFPRVVSDKIKETAGNGKPGKSVIFLSRIGALYPFYRTSSLLRYLDTGTRIPVIVLYPGERLEQYFLSFMGEMDADRDYRPRIY